MPERPLISVVIATAPGHERTLERTIAAYRRESDGVTLELLPYELGAWARGARDATGTYVHMSGDWLEPHPGWWLAAIAAARVGIVPAPVLWRPEGTLAFPDEPQIDWNPCDHSRVPFFSRGLLTQALATPEGSRPDLKTALRLEYAFTLHDGVAGPTPK